MQEKTKYLKQLNYIVDNKAKFMSQLNIIDEKIDNIVLIGCGATLSQMYVFEYLLDLHVAIPVRIMNSGEAFARKPKSITENTLVITSSHSGSTLETVNAAEMSKEKGAKVVAITANIDSNLAKIADVVLDYPKVGIAPSESKLMLLYLLSIKLLATFGFDKEDKEVQWEKLPELLWRARESSNDNAKKFAENFSDKKMFYILGAGATYGAAYAFSICKFMEMQWIDSTALQCGEYFHGPLEKAEEETAYILLKAEGITRDLALRVEDFIQEYSKNVEIIDTSEQDLEDLDKAFYSPIFLWPVMNIYMEYFAKATGHSLDIRRYMGKVSY